MSLLQRQPLRVPLPLPLEPGLVLYMPMLRLLGDKVYDWSGRGNHGTIYGATWTLGRIGWALGFDGNDYVLVAASASLNSIVGELTVMAWVKEAVRGVSLKVVDRRSDMAFWFLGSGDGCPYGGIGDGVTYSMVKKDATMPLDEWHHLAFVFDDAKNKGWLYYDGGLTKEGTIPQSIGALTNIKLSVGAGSQGTTYFFNGVIALVHVYSRALSAAEVRRLYEVGRLGLRGW